MSASQIVKKTQLPTPMVTDFNNQSSHPVQEDCYQYLMLDSANLGAIDRAWLDARERSVINLVIMKELDNIMKSTVTTLQQII